MEDIGDALYLRKEIPQVETILFPGDVQCLRVKIGDGLFHAVIGYRQLLCHDLVTQRQGLLK